MPTVVQTFRHLRRYQQVGRILTRYGFGYVLTQLGIGRAIAPGLEKLRFSSAEILRATPPERMRMVVEELGPAFIKLGQILSTRGDLLPPDFIHELERLQDTVPPTDFSLIQEQVERELKKPLAEVFPHFDPVPVASASLGQVHFATLADGQEVAVKLLRPGVDRLIETDLDILLELAALAEKRTEWGQYYNVVSLAREFADTLRLEQNYEQEGLNMDRYRQMFAGVAHVLVPRVYWETTTRRVLTMERIQGIKITDVARLEAAGLDPALVARRNLDLVLRAILQEGYFHADPHAGNFLVLPNEVIALVDFGIMGELDDLERMGLVQMFVGLFRVDAARVARGMSELGIATRGADMRKLTRDLDHLRMRYYGLDLEKIHAHSFFEDLMGLAFANRLVMPSDLVLVFKTIAMMEGIGLQLDPELNIFDEVEPYVREVLLELESPVARLKELAEQMRESSQAVMMLPRQLQRMLEQMESGESNLRMELKGLDEPTRRVTAAANRLALAILAVAFVIGPALLIPHLNTVFPEWRTGAAFLIFGGFGLSVLITLGLIVSVLRRGS
ncbi:MAG TPA: AarF/ABC1/UbiB kinase family protein [Anaerolineae bacterium]|nr:AarF/ABC1/UbiB kinase family protein [Anaerolineae bacterium]